MLSILTRFLSNRPQHVTVGGCRSNLVNVVSGMLPGSVFLPLIVPPVRLGAFFHSGD